MISNRKSYMPASILRRAFAILAAILLAAPLLAAQGPPSHFVGTVTAISGNTLSVKTDADGIRQFDVPSTTVIKRISPGDKDLSHADTLQFNDLATGDRVLVKLNPAAPGPPAEALQIIAVKQADLAKKQEQERRDWQVRGVGGLVKSVDPATGTIVLTSGTGATAKTITVQTGKETILKRYAPNSVLFDEAKAASIDAIHPGDQLRARGTKNDAGTEIAAEEVVSGTFRNISGIVLSLDPSTQTLQVKDLLTKKPVTVHIPADTQLRKLPERMAQALAARLGGAAGEKGEKSSWHRSDSSASPHGEFAANPQQILNRAPVIQLADLKKGDAVMIVATDGKSEVTAVTLVAGVEPLLESAAATQNLLSNWSMGSSGSSSQDTAPE